MRGDSKRKVNSQLNGTPTLKPTTRLVFRTGNRREDSNGVQIERFFLHFDGIKRQKRGGLLCDLHTQSESTSKQKRSVSFSSHCRCQFRMILFMLSTFDDPFILPSLSSVCVVLLEIQQLENVTVAAADFQSPMWVAQVRARRKTRREERRKVNKYAPLLFE